MVQTRQTFHATLTDMWVNICMLAASIWPFETAQNFTPNPSLSP